MGLYPITKAKKTKPSRSDAPDTQFLPNEPVTEAFDAIVVCAALGAGALLRPLGIKLPLLAVHGYSVTAPLRHNEHHPQSRHSAHGDRCGVHCAEVCRAGSHARS